MRSWAVIAATRPLRLMEASGRVDLQCANIQVRFKVRSQPRTQLQSCRAANCGEARIAHSQTTATRHPRQCNCSIDRRSRATFAANLSFQNSALFLGVAAFRQPSCRCQKHPCTNTAAPNLLSAKSGEPGRLRTSMRNRKPAANSSDRRALSGSVSLRLIARMFWRRAVVGSDMVAPMEPLTDACCT